MSTEYDVERIDTENLRLKFFLVPWDSEIAGQPVAELKEIELLGREKAYNDYEGFRGWLSEHKVLLCSCRVAQERIAEIMFLEDQGFRFIELNYRPRLTTVSKLEFPQEQITVELANDGDREALASIASRAFPYGRFHQDPRVAAGLGDRRYRTWLWNGFRNSRQQVVKCLLEGEVVGFFVAEYPEAGHCFWSLCALEPSFQGQGLGKRVWKAMLRWHQVQGIDTVSTSISSHNVPVLNLYASLGFRFAAPTVTLHWMPAAARDRIEAGSRKRSVGEGAGL